MVLDAVAMENLPVNLPVPLDISYYISLLVPTIVATVALLIAIEILHERPHYIRAFVVAFIANYTTPFAYSFFGSQLSGIPYGFYIIGILVWIILIKIFFRMMPLKHVVYVGVLGYGINIGLSMLGLYGLVRSLLKMFIPFV
ncbi:MAG: hypothetical protein ABEK17_04135 [Candidatus Aenigmatarchaeota archaeon]